MWYAAISILLCGLSMIAGVLIGGYLYSANISYYNPDATLEDLEERIGESRNGY